MIMQQTTNTNNYKNASNLFLKALKHFEQFYKHPKLFSKQIFFLPRLI